MADGTLKFDTKVDDSGFLQGIQNLSSKQIKLQNSINKTRYDMEKLDKAINANREAKLPTQEYQDIQKQIGAAEKKLNGYLDTEQRMKDTGADLGGQSWKNLQWKIDDARKSVEAAKADMTNLESTGGAFTIGGDTTKLTDMQNKYSLLSGKMSEYQSGLVATAAKEVLQETAVGRVAKVLMKLASAASKVWSVLKKLGSIAGTIAGKLGKMAVGVGKTAGKLFSHIGKLNGLFSRGKKDASGYGMSIKNALKSVILYQGINKVLTGLAETLMNAMKTNKQFVSSLAQVKGNLFTAFQPVFEAIMPAINVMMQGLAKLTGYLAQFTSMLFGKSLSASQAAAKAQYDQAKALTETGKAAKDAKKQLSDIDQLHNTNDDNSSDSGKNEILPDFSTPIDTSDNVSDFVKRLKEAWSAADFTEIGEIVAGKLNGALESINWDKIQGTTQKIAKSIYTFINGFVAGLDWKLVGSTIGNGINTAVQFADTMITGIDWSKLGTGLGTGLQSAIKTVDWKGAGKLVSDGLNSIATFINSFYKSVDWVGFGSNLASGFNNAIKNTNWTNVGTAIGNALNIAIDTAYGFVTNFDWKKFGQGIADGLNGMLKTTNWVELAKGASKLATGLLNSIATAIKEVDWRLVGNTIADMILNIDWAGIAAGIIDLLVAAFNGLVSLIFGIGEKIGKNIADGLKDGISLSDIIKNAGTWIKTHIFDPIVNNIKSLFGIHSPSTVMAEIGTNIMQGMINGITSLVDTVKSKFKSLVGDIKGFFTDIPTWFEGKFNSALEKIKAVFSDKAVSSHFSSVLSSIKSTFSGIADWFKTTFTTAWTNVKNVFSTGGKIFDGIKDGIADTFKAVVQRLIDGINAIIRHPFEKINSMLNSIKSVSILGVKPFNGLWDTNPLQIPQIPALATGTVVPRNYGSFLSILGDNKKDPEIVSPVPTMEQAVENVLNRMGVGGNGDISLHLTLVRDGKKEYDNIMKINREQATSGKLSFALN